MNQKVRFLKDLSASLSVEIVNELLFIFDKQFKEEIPLLVSYSEKKDYESASKLSHKLKSSALNVGAIEIAEIFKRLEKDTRNNLNRRTLDEILSLYDSFYIVTKSWSVF